MKDLIFIIFMLCIVPWLLPLIIDILTDWLLVIFPPAVVFGLIIAGFGGVLYYIYKKEEEL
jgi:hypothetical protein